MPPNEETSSSGEQNSGTTIGGTGRAEACIFLLCSYILRPRRSDIDGKTPIIRDFGVTFVILIISFDFTDAELVEPSCCGRVNRTFSKMGGTVNISCASVTSMGFNGCLPVLTDADES